MRPAPNRLVLLAALAALSLPGAPRAAAGERLPLPGAGVELGVPADGLDRVRLDDGRVIACRLETPKGEEILLHFPTFTAKVPKARVVESRLFRDYEPAPRTEEEKALAARGLVRFGGRWIGREAAEKAVQAEKDAARRFREEDDSHSKWENRWRLETAHFRFEANIPREALDAYAALLEPFYDFMTRTFQITLTQREKKRRLPVFLFRRQDEFRKKHDEDTGGKSESLLGYFVLALGGEQLVFFDIAGDRRETVDVMLHEGTHFIIHLAEPKVIVSRWIHEGCAEYFGSASFDGKRFTTGLVQDGRLLHFQDMIAGGRVLPMEHLLRAGNPYASGDEPVDFKGEEYAQAWTLVHFLMEGRNGRYRSGFVSFLQKQLQRKGTVAVGDRQYMPYEEARAQLLRCLGLKDFDGLTKELVEYGKALPLRSALAYVRRGGDRWFSEKQDKAGAESDFASAFRRGADDPAVLAALANTYAYIPEKSADAVPLMKRALELDPLNARLRHQYAHLLSPEERAAELERCVQVDPDYGPALADFAWTTYRDGFRDRDRVEEGEETERARAAIAMAERAVALDPSASAYHTLGCLYLAVGEFAKAREAMKPAVEMDPERMEYLWRLAQCHAFLGEPEDFARILRRIELLKRRAAKPAEGETLEEGAGATIEQIHDEMGALVAEMADKCLRWGRPAEACAAMDAWHEKRPPKTREQWEFWARVFREKGDLRRAARIADAGLKAFPESDRLKEILRLAPPAAGSDGEGER